MPVHAGEKKRNFTLVIDAGHGGHDSGAVGAWSKEKNINLTVALAFGKLVEDNCRDVKVVYTRSTDIFVPLQRRADIANNCKADLFISVHTNALPGGRIAYGSETYSLGMARAGENLEVAKRENSVITLENDYQRTYEGFDPNKAESYVIFEIMQDRYMKQSVELARCIQRQYKGAGRPDKGVHQAGFLVLRKTSMPAVLTELGFISTPAEESYLNSQRGVDELSRGIYNGFLAYRRQYDKTAADIPADLPQLPVAEPSASSARDLAAEVVPVQVSSNKEAVSRTAENTTPKPEMVPAPRAAVAEKEQQAAESKSAPKSQEKRTVKNAAAKAVEKKLVVSVKVQEKPAAKEKGKSATKDNTKKADAVGKLDAARKTDTAKETGNAKKTGTTKPIGKADAGGTKTKRAASTKVVFRVQLGAGKREIAESDPQFKGLPVTRRKEGTMYKYLCGSYATYAAAQKALAQIKEKMPAAYIVAYKDGTPVSVAEARAAAQGK